MKSYTDLEQSKKLAEILPFESADNYYSWHDERYYVVNKDCPYPYSLKEKIPCWSLSALLSVLGFPSLTQNVESKWFITDWTGAYPKSEYGSDNPVDACYEMILKLYELNLL